MKSRASRQDRGSPRKKRATSGAEVTAAGAAIHVVGPLLRLTPAGDAARMWLSVAAMPVVLAISSLVVGGPPRYVHWLLAGDIFYEQTPAIDIEGFLRREAARGALVLIGDPGRKYLPREGLTEIARYDVPTTLEIEDREIREGVVWRVD